MTFDTNDTGLLVAVVMFVLFARVCYELLVAPASTRKVPTPKDIENARTSAKALAAETTAERIANDARCALLTYAQRGHAGAAQFEALGVAGATVADAQRLLIRDGFTCSYAKGADGYLITIDTVQMD